jgi:hypothetical protein
MLASQFLKGMEKHDKKRHRSGGQPVSSDAGGDVVAG